MDNRKKLIIFFIFLVALVIGGVAIYLGYKFSQQPDDKTPDDTSTGLTCDMAFEETFDSAGGLDTSKFQENMTTGATVNVADGLLNLSIPDSEAIGTAGFKTTSNFQGDFIVTVDIRNFTVSETQDRAGVELSFPEASYYKISVEPNQFDRNQIVVSGEIFGGDSFEQVLPIITSVEGNLIKLQIEREIISDAADDQAKITLRYDYGEGFVDLVSSQNASIYSGAGKFNVNAFSTEPEYPDISTALDSFAITCPIGDAQPTILTPTSTPQPTVEPQITGFPTVVPTSSVEATPDIQPTATTAPRSTTAPAATTQPTATPIPGATTVPSGNDGDGGTLPETALISDEVDRFLIAFVLIGLGYYIYRQGIYLEVGSYFWEKFGKIYLPYFSDRYAKEAQKDYEKDVENKFTSE